MVEINNISFSYENGKKIFENFSCSFQKGERVCLSAPSGRGKSTLLRLICSLEKPNEGKIKIAPSLKIAFASQSSDLFPWYTAKKNVSLVCGEKKAEELLERFGLKACFEMFPAQLSAGMQKRVSIARAVAFGSDILLLDEAFNGLDEKIKSEIMAFLKEEYSQKLIIFASHNQSEADEFATRQLKF